MPVEVEALEFPDVKIVRPRKVGDDRGFLSETFSRRDLEAVGIDLDIVQENHVVSGRKNILRGLHFQMPPFAQAKLVRVTRGAILDVSVDIRTGSPTFGQHVSAVISAKDWNQILVPVGFAHGLLTLEPDTEVIYKMTNYYSPEHDRGILWNDPALGIDWGIAEDEAILSDKDRVLPKLADLPPLFGHEKEGAQ